MSEVCGRLSLDNATQFPCQLFFAGHSSSFVFSFLAFLDGGVWGTWRYTVGVVMADSRRALVCKVGIGVGGRAQFVESIAFAGDGLTPISTDVWQKATVADSSLVEDEVMRKKFLIFWLTCELEPLTDLLVDMDTPEKVRRSPGMMGYGGAVDWRDGKRRQESTAVEGGDSKGSLRVVVAAVNWARTRERARTAGQGYASAWRRIFPGLVVRVCNVKSNVATETDRVRDSSVQAVRLACLCLPALAESSERPNLLANYYSCLSIPSQMVEQETATSCDYGLSK
ncbi:hypothetical protein KCU99_g212, partial [Aureobasidium melanogenum]